MIEIICYFLQSGRSDMFPFEFKKEPKACEAGGVKFGGQPGDYPYVCVSSIVSNMPFCADTWAMKPKLEGAAYCAEKGLLDRMSCNGLTVWEQVLEAEVREISQIGGKG
jgi:tetrahydromethanopterin S-methyltransferase subunit H